MGNLGAGINLRVIVGPLWRALSGVGVWALLAAAALAFVDFVTFFDAETLLRRTRRAPSFEADRCGSLGRWPILSVLLMYFLTFLCLTNLQVALALLAQFRLAWGPREVAWLFTIFAAASFIVQGVLIGRLSRRVGEVTLVVLGALCSALGMLLIGEARQPTVLVAGVALFGMGFGTTTPVLTSLGSQVAREDARGFVLGILQSSGGLARTFGPLLGGVLFQRVAPAHRFSWGSWPR
jgi:MFS family permease